MTLTKHFNDSKTIRDLMNLSVKIETLEYVENSKLFIDLDLINKNVHTELVEVLDDKPEIPISVIQGSIKKVLGDSRFILDTINDLVRQEVIIQMGELCRESIKEMVEVEMGKSTNR